ncbi:hypothetical protein [Nocardia bhagyanarayanae]|uniref:hypothetical protein n=1 Tax=Nocardia bhagyanarayanae TaxID=1215925 RepID=UPI001FE9B1B6|nr:hypothetical protein [Nocardia bhagyanarayanae]
MRKQLAESGLGGVWLERNTSQRAPGEVYEWCCEPREFTTGIEDTVKSVDHVRLWTALRLLDPCQQVMADQNQRCQLTQ